jgi:2-hydroxy-3-keto-5-methylthiopentenyl-1-phosphate phosphatase
MDDTMAVPTPPAAPQPDFARLLVLLDYDGTVTDREYAVLALQQLTGDAWRVPDQAAARGEIGHAECLRRQIELLTSSKEEFIDASSRDARLAGGFAGFLAALVAGGARVAVVSAGFRQAIEAVWRREALPPVELFASAVVPRDGSTGPPWTVRFDPRLGDCPTCGPRSCKGGVLRLLRRPGDTIAVFGDGISDLCLARDADVVFARGRLVELCEREGIAYHRLSDYRPALLLLTDLMTPRVTTS